MPQLGYRKRLAPGASPLDRHQQQTIMTNNDSLPQFSDDQYMQWNAQQVANSLPSYPDPTGSFSPKVYSGTTQSQSDYNIANNQVVRRPTSNMVTRGSSQNASSGTWPPTTNGNASQVTEKAWQNDGSDLEQRAIAAEREARAKRKQIPPFVQKLSSFLDESRNTELIRWSDSGDSFIVVDEDEFARTLIPELFKHNNYASFVRQLNMYGFHKKVGLSDNSMRASERKAKPPSEYTNQFFKRGRPRLLWLIQKPKNEVRGTGKGRRAKQEDADFDDDGDETLDIDSPVPTSQPMSGSALRIGRPPLMIGNTNGASAPQDLDSIRQELANIRQQQAIISHAINKIRQNHDKLYGQAVTFQNQHDRHESSINAILTFLATVYNRSLDGGTGQNFANMFAGILPQDTQASGNVRDVGDEGSPNFAKAQIQQRFKKQQLLLKGPPDLRNGRTTPSTSDSAIPYVHSQSRDSSTLQNPHNQSYNAHSPVIRELADTPSARSSQSPQFPANSASSLQIPEADILSLINSTNANSHNNPTTTRMDFPEALKHLQNCDGQSPLTSNQRNDVLRLMGNSTDQNGIANAFTLTTPPTGPDLSQYNATNDTLDFLGKSLQEQDSKVANMERLLAPLSPSGSIPGFEGSAGVPGQDMLDLDQIFNSGDYYDSTSHTDFGNSNSLTDGALTGGFGGDFDPNFDFDTAVGDRIYGDGIDGNANTNGDTAVNGDGGRFVETLNSSEATSPANTVDEQEGGSPRKRRRNG